MGNYSQDPADVLEDAQGKSYNKVRFQQGKPILDRELNLLVDLCGVPSLRRYIGSGVPTNSNGFQIVNVDFENQDFTIVGAECMVDGYPVAWSTNTTYKQQPFMTNPPAWPSEATKLFVILSYETKEITDAEDEDLQNGSDIGFETTLREQVQWTVSVARGFLSLDRRLLLAELDTQAKTVTDRRLTNMTLSTIRDDLNNVATTTTATSARVNNFLAPDGTLKDNLIATAKLQNGAVTTAKLQDNCVNTSKLRDNSVTTAKLEDNSVSAAKLQDNAISMAKLQDNSVSSAKLQDNAVTAAKLQDNSVSTAKLQNGSITTAKLGADCVTLNNIANGSVSGPKLKFLTLVNSSTTLTAGQTKEILILDNLSPTKQAFYFPIISLASTSGSSGSSVVESQVIFKQSAGAPVCQLFLRLKNTPTNANSVDVLYRVDMFDPQE